MLISFDHRAGLMALTIIGLAFAASACGAESLTLADAQELAVARDTGRSAFEAQAQAARDRAVAAGELPDPEARVGAVNVPVDALDLDRDDMTMIEVGLLQRFPAGRTRSLSRQQLEHHALHFDAEAVLRDREVRLAVARSWHELDFLEATAAALAESRERARLLIEGATAAYASGGGSHAEVLDARLAMMVIDELLIGRRRERDSAIAELQRWIGPDAGGRRPAPMPLPVPALAALRARLAQHPALRGLEHEAGAARLETELARQRYKPAFGLDLGYGFRQGRDMAGAARADLLTAMLTFDLPLFTRDRQDREFAAARSMQRQAESQREDATRELDAQLTVAHATAESLAQSLALYQSDIAPLTGAAVEAALSAYRAGEGSLTEVIAAQQRQLELRERELRLRTDCAIAIAQLEALAGELP